MRKESSTLQKCKRQMATLGFDSQLAYHRVKLILKIYRDVVWVLSERVEELRFRRRQPRGGEARVRDLRWLHLRRRRAAPPDGG